MATAKKDDKADPTVTSAKAGPVYPEGTHPPRDLADVTGNAESRKYKENPDKPDPTTVAQVEVTD